MYKNAQYYNGMDGTVAGIRVEINGVLSYVPICPGNTDYDNIMALVAAGQLIIEPAS